jgi:putative PIN family toxin of toxin-antitoxin system
LKGLKVFVDTNAWAAGFAGGGLCAELLDFVKQRHRAVASPQVRRELAPVLVKKLKMLEPVAAAALSEFDAMVQLQPDPSHCSVRTRDPKDDPILQAALDADADWLVTGDADLTVLKRVKGMPVTTPRDFLEALGVEEPWP